MQTICKLDQDVNKLTVHIFTCMCKQMDCMFWYLHVIKNWLCFYIHWMFVFCIAGCCYVLTLIYLTLPNSKFQLVMQLLLLCLYLQLSMAEILPIRRKTLSNQSINQWIVNKHNKQYLFKQWLYYHYNSSLCTWCMSTKKLKYSLPIYWFCYLFD